MLKCSYCGAELPENSRFCGKCGRVQDATATDAATTRSNTPQPYWTEGGKTLSASDPSYAYPVQDAYPTPGSQPSWPANNGSASVTPPPPPVQNEDERRVMPPWSTQYGVGPGAGAVMSGGQQYGYGAPVVQGTPQIGGVPNVAGSPPLSTPSTNPPAGHFAQGPGYSSPVTQAAPTAATKVAGASGLKTIIIVVAVVVVVVGGGIAAAAYFLNRPQPTISVASSYKVGNTLAGANGTVLHISGQKFSSNSAITFLLDGNPAPGNPSAQSDANGNFSANVPVTGAWSIGNHMLTARDAGNNSPKEGVSVTIVQPGTANTPGPNGAPPDDATFTVSVSAKGTYNLGKQPFTRSETLNIKGHPDPTGGTVCRDADSGQKFTTQNITLDTHIPFTETYSLACQGSYKSGKITYTETVLTDVITYPSTGASCRLVSPQMNQQITGSYTAQHTFSGTLVYERVPQSDFHCTNPNAYFYYIGGQGTWTGTVSGLQG